MGFIRYARPGDNIAAGTAWTASAEDPDYPATNLTNLDPSFPAKLTTTTGYWTRDFGAPVSAIAAGFVNHNLDAALANVKIQGNSSSDFTTPAFSQTFTIPADEDGGAFPNVSVGPWVLFAATKTYRYWRLYFGTANAAPIGIGELMLLAATRTLFIDPAPGREDSEDHPDIVHASSFGGETIYPIGARWKTWDGTMPGTEEDDHWSLTRNANGRSRPWFFVPDHLVNSCYLVRFDWSAPRFGVARLGGTFVSVPAFRIRELSRGVPL